MGVLPECTCMAPDVKSINSDALAVSYEADYEKNCTRLYKSIETEEWDLVTSFLDTGYWPNSFFPDEICPNEQAKTWVTRFKDKSKNDVEWSQLPLHLAVVVKAPLEIIRRLVDLYPDAVRCTDDENMLPFHLAMRYGSADEIVDYLLQKFPDAVIAKGKKNRSAIEIAMRSHKKARARIIKIFVEKGQSNACQHIASLLKENSSLKQRIQGKVEEVEKLHKEKAKCALDVDLGPTNDELVDSKTMNVEQKKPEENTKEECLARKQTVDTNEELQSKSKQSNELAIVKKDQPHKVKKEEALKKKEELGRMKSLITKKLKDSKGRTKKELLAIKGEVDAMSEIEDKSPKEFEVLQSDVASLWMKLAEIEEVAKPKEVNGIGGVPSPFSEDSDMLILKRTVLSIYEEQVEVKNTDNLKEENKTVKSKRLFSMKSDKRSLRSLLGFGRDNKARDAPSSKTSSSGLGRNILTILPPCLSILKSDFSSDTDSSNADAESNSSFPETTRTLSYGNVTKSVGPGNPQEEGTSSALVVREPIGRLFSF